MGGQHSHLSVSNLEPGAVTLCKHSSGFHIKFDCKKRKEHYACINFISTSSSVTPLDWTKMLLRICSCFLRYSNCLVQWL